MDHQGCWPPHCAVRRGLRCSPQGIGGAGNLAACMLGPSAASVNAEPIHADWGLLHLSRLPWAPTQPTQRLTCAAHQPTPLALWTQVRLATVVQVLWLRQACLLNLHEDQSSGAAGALNYVTISGLLPDTVYFYKAGDLVRASSSKIFIRTDSSEQIDDPC